MNFCKIGDTRVNLDQVTHVEEFVASSSDPDKMEPTEREGVRVFFAFASTDYAEAFVRFYGDEAKLLLAIIDQDDEAVDALYERMYRTPVIVAVGLCPRCNGRMFWTDEDHDAVRCSACQYLMAAAKNIRPISDLDSEPETLLTTEQVEALGGAIEAADEVDTSRAYPINFINFNNPS